MKHHEQLSDEQLLALSEGQEDYFYLLMKRYETKLLRYILKMTRHQLSDAEDILQEVFIKVYKNQRGFNPKLKFSSWIYRIAHNEVVNMYRKNRSGKGLISIDDTETDAKGEIAILADTLDVQAAYISEEIRMKLRNALSNISADYREILVLRYFEELSYSEISDILMKPQGTVATLINRAKSALKKAFGRINVKESL